MSFALSKTSIARLRTCDERLQHILAVAILVTDIDFTVVQGHRGEEEQNHYYDTGKSQLRWPESKHNKEPSLGVDVCPYVDGKLDWYNIKNFEYLANLFKEIAERQDVDLIWGGDWPNFKDRPHFQIGE